MNKKLILLVVSLVFALFASILIINNENKENKNNILISKLAAGEIDEISLNEEKITLAEIEEVSNKLPEEILVNTNKEEVVNSIINEKLLLQEAKKKEILVSNAEVDDFIELGLQMSGMSEEEYKAKLAEYGITEGEYKEQIKEQIMVAKLINQSIEAEDYEVSDNEIDRFLEDNGLNEFLEEGDGQDAFELKKRVESQLEFEKKNALLQEYVNSLRDKADIK